MKISNDKHKRRYPSIHSILNACRCKFYYFLFFYLFIFSSGVQSFSQDESEYIEISVFLEVQNVGGGEVDVLIKGEEVFMPITDIFSFLKIRNIPSPSLDSISGFFVNQDAQYLIDRINNQIHYNGTVYDLDQGSLVRTESNLYMLSRYYGSIFGLDSKFNFRNMSITINPRFELPVIREMRQKEMRENLDIIKDEVKADTNIKRQFPLFRIGTADWSATVTERVNGPVNTRLNLTLGSMLAGGEAIIGLNYYSNNPFQAKDQFYRWRYVNNDNSVLKQAIAGKIATGSISSIYDPVIGVQLTNTPTTFKKSFGSYTLSDRTEPGWIVELYVNNVLVDYVKADASGFFSFDVPLVYGNSNVTLKFFGPWGEERIREQNISIPFNFLPRNSLEYKVSAGVVEDTSHSKFSRADVNYGLTRSITIGVGYEYFSRLSSGNLMPFINGSFRLASNLLFSGEYTHTVQSKAKLSYNLKSKFQFDINYIKYAKGQKAINRIYLEERKISLTIPLRIKKLSVYNRLSINQLVMPKAKFTTTEWLLSASFYGVNANITSYALYVDNTNPYIYSNFSLSFRLPGGFTIIPQTQYTYSDRKFLSAKIGMEKRAFKQAYLSLSYENNFRNNKQMIELGFRYDFQFAKSGFTTRFNDNSTTSIQYAAGSLIADNKTSYIGTDNRTNVGKGGITIIPFVDKNFNGKKDPGEPKAYGLDLRTSSGRIVRSEKDTIIRILTLEPYTDCFIELNPSSFDNIAWRLENKTISVGVNPNMLKLIEIPVVVVGEASGMVMLEKKGYKDGLARIIVNFYNNENHKKVGRTLSESDGYYSYFGLLPGSYTAKLDSLQLKKLHMYYTPKAITFDIDANMDGDYIDGLDFTIVKEQDEKIIEPEELIVWKDTSINIPDVKQVMVPASENYFIQLGAFKNIDNANELAARLDTLLVKKAEVFLDNELYKVLITGFESRKEVDGYVCILGEHGCKNVWVSTLKGMQKNWIKINKPNTINEIIETLAVEDTSYLTIQEKVIEDIPVARESYAIQIGAFESKVNAYVQRKKISADLDRAIDIVSEGGLHKVRISGFNSKQELNDYIPEFIRKSKDIEEIWIISLINYN